MEKHRIENSGHGHCITMLADGACHRPIHGVTRHLKNNAGDFFVRYWRHNPKKKPAFTLAEAVHIQ